MSTFITSQTDLTGMVQSIAFKKCKVTYLCEALFFIMLADTPACPARKISTTIKPPSLDVFRFEIYINGLISLCSCATNLASVYIFDIMVVFWATVLKVLALQTHYSFYLPNNQLLGKVKG